MSGRYRYAGLGALLLTFACGSRVEIGHGNEGGDGNASGSGGSAGSADGGTTAESGSGGTVGAGAGGSGTSGSIGVGGPIPKDNGPQKEVTKVDLLVAVDNSISMADKQRLFAKAVPELVSRLVNPPCIKGAGAIVSQPASSTAACPSGSQRATEPLRDLHIGVITSSMGAHGANGANDVCTRAADDDHAHLLPTVRNGIDSYNGKGFLKWDPDGVASPAGESDPAALAAALGTMVEAAGELGCGYEAQLESVYRFLVDPDPPQSVELRADNLTAKVGTDYELLSQRDSFLRPDSSVVVLMLTDENDCSIVDEGYGWLVNRLSVPGKTPNMYRSTSQCASDPNDACCQSCGETAANEGCPDIRADAQCLLGQQLDDADDNPNLRCFDQKRRFGFDLLYPTERYVGGFGGGKVLDRNGQLVDNPLFYRDGVARDPSLFTFAVIGGMPWQDIATADSLTGDELTLMSPSQLESDGRWPMLIGDVNANVPPTDPFMRESTEERSGKNPLTQESIVSSSSTDPTANSINGHEQKTFQFDLQYACTYQLPEPVVCDPATAYDVGCDCFPEELQTNRSACNPPGGGAPTTTQHYGKAYPALRELRVARELGRRTVLGSVCSRNTQDDTRSDYGYRPIFAAIGERVAATLTEP
jgi:hypothetical protein